MDNFEHSFSPWVTKLNFKITIGIAKTEMRICFYDYKYKHYIYTLHTHIYIYIYRLYIDYIYADS